MSNKDKHLTKGDNPLLGVGFALCAAIMLSSMNMFAKLLSSIHDPIEITFWRNLIARALLLAGLVVFKKLHLLKTNRPWAQLWRSIVGTTGMIFSVWAASLMPLTTATAFIFTAPLFVILMSYPILKERVGIYRILAVILGVSGVLLIANPEGGISSLALTVGLLAGFFNGMVAIFLRWLGSTENTATTNFYFFLYGLIGTGIAMPFIYTPPIPETSLWIVAIGIVGLLSLLFKTQGFRLGPASLISPISYTMLVWASLYDYFIWNTLPTPSVLIGAFIIISSNIFILWREQKLKQN